MKNYYNFTDKRILITGSSGDIGTALVKEFYELGATIISISRTGGSIVDRQTHYNCDITSNNEILSVINQHAKIDVLVNNVGITLPGNLLTYSDIDWEHTFNTNLKSIFQISKIVGTKMKNNKTKGSIVNISSIASEFAFPNNPSYGASKAGLVQLTKCFALELGKSNITVNSISPGYIRTKMTQKSQNNPHTQNKIQEKTMLNRWGVPEDIAGLVIFLTSDKARYITGQNIFVDGGWSSKGL